MMKIEAIVRNSVLHEIQDNLAEIGIPTFSAYQVQITGIHRAHVVLKNNTSDFIPTTKIEILCADKDEEKILNTIQHAASTVQNGDGVVFTFNVNKIIKIKDKQTDEDAL